MPKIVITIDSSSEAKVKIENTKIDVDIEYKGEKYSFKTHKDDPLRRMFLDFCDTLKLSYGSIKFTLLGGRDVALINETQTADDLELSDGDTIYASSRIDVHIQYKEKKYSFNTYSDVPLRGMFNDFCNSIGHVDNNVRFKIGSALIKEAQTADELGIEDGHTIYAEKIRIVVSVQHYNGKGKYRYVIRRDVPMRRMFLDFCNRLNVPDGELRFVFNGRTFCETKTPDDLGMDDDDLIDALDRQYG